MAMIGIYRGLVVDALTIPRAPGIDLWVVEANTRGPFAEASRIPAGTRESIARIAGAGGISYQTVEATYRGRKLRLYVIGYEPTRPGGPPVIVRGRGIARSHFEMVADRSAGLVLDDRVRLGRTILIVYTMTIEKLKQIATLKLIGSPARTIVGMIVQQAVALGLVAFSIGVLLIVNVKD